MSQTITMKTFMIFLDGRGGGEELGEIEGGEPVIKMQEKIFSIKEKIRCL